MAKLNTPKSGKSARLKKAKKAAPDEAADTPNSTCSSAQDQLSPADLAALDSFCKDLCYDEISFSTWQDTSTLLDLTVPLWLPEHLAATGGEYQLNFCRQVRCQIQDPPERQKTSYLVTIPANSRDGDSLVIPAQGDKVANKSGSLILQLKIKK